MTRRCAAARVTDGGYAMAALLVGMAVMGIMLSMAMPVWRTAVQREREAELVFRGEQYAQAIQRYQARTGSYPPSLDVLAEGRFIRKLYKDPITGEDFQPVIVGQIIGGQPVVPGQPAARGGAGARGRAAGPAARGRGAARQTGPAMGSPLGTPRGRGTAAGPIIGVVSRSTADSLRVYNGRGKYNEWAFVATATTQQAGGAAGTQNSGVPGRGGPPGARIGGPARPLPFPGRQGAPQSPNRGIPFPGRGGAPGRGAAPQ